MDAIKKTARLMENVPIQDIKPYWRNPRNNAFAIEKVKLSIERYGYNNYIIVDKNLVIIAGHTRYVVLNELGYTNINVLVADYLTDVEAKEYRIIDNKSAEFSTWNEALKIELKELNDISFMQNFFEEVIILDKVEGEDAEKIELELNTDFSSRKFDKPRILVCPKCKYEMTVIEGINVV